MPTPSNYQVLSHIIRNPSSPKNGVRILEAYLTIAWCDAHTPEPVALSYAAIRNHTNLTVNTVRTGIDELNTSGRWAITKHTGSTASTYLPLFLDEIEAASEETLTPEQPAAVPTPPVQPTAVEPASLLIPEPSPAYEAPEPVVAQEPVDAGSAAEYTDDESWNAGYPDDYFDEPDYPDPDYFADPEEAEAAEVADTPETVVMEAPVVIASPAVHEESVVAAPPAAPAPTWVAATTADFITAKSKKYDALEGLKSEDAEELLSALEIILNGREVPKRYEERFLGTMRGKRVVSPDQPFEDFVKAASPAIEQFLSMVL